MLQAAELFQKIKKRNLTSFFTTGHSRSVKTKKNILALIIIKGVSILTSFLLVPLTINYLTPLSYGIWLTLYSIISWFGLLDIGLGNGMRNKFAEAIAIGDKQSARIYVSTTYAILVIIFLCAGFIFFAVNHFLDWSLILNTGAEKTIELQQLAAIVFGFFCLQMVVKLISSILLADQRTALAAAINTVCSVLSLIVVYILTKTTSGSLTYLATAIGLINIIVPLLASFWFFKNYYKEFAPSWKHIDFKRAKDLMNLGVMFFLFQSTALIVVATDNVIISQLFGPDKVTPYNIALKYFTPITLLFSIISAPMWSAYTESYTKKDFDWIKRITNKMIRVWLLVFVAVIPMIIFSDFAYGLWVGSQIHISLDVTVLVAVYVLFSSWNQIFGNFINGVGKLRLGFYLTIFTAVINIPLSIFLAKYTSLGVAGIIAASCISLLPDIIFIPIQYFKIIHNKATGIWNK